MKIEEIMIYGFGKHENVSLKFHSNMNVLYGLNEAGKTTIHQFILHILFGFPARNSSLLRYEPRFGSKYGGKIFLRDQRFGKCTIERVEGKSAGDVTVYFEDGTEGKEEALQKILRGYDRAAFEAIFSFSLLQLQAFEKMNEEELSRTLFASGTTGIDSLLAIEKRLETAMGELFKRSGRVPEMNVKLKELKELENNLKKEEEKVSEYTPAMERIKEIEEHLLTLRNREKSQQDQIQIYSNLQQQLPLREQKIQLEKRLKASGDIHFPADGIRRFESLSSKLKEVEAAKSRLMKELHEAEKESVNENATDDLIALEHLLGKESEWHQWRAALRTVQEDLNRLHSLEKRYADRLGINLEEVQATLLVADVSIRKEEEMYELLKQMEYLNRDMHIIDSQKQQLTIELEETRRQLQQLNPPSAKEEQEAEEWAQLKQKLAEARAYVSLGEEKEANQKNHLSIVFFGLAVVLLAFGVTQQQWLFILVGIVFGGGGAFLFSKQERSKDTKMEQMREFVKIYEGQVLEKERLTEMIFNYRTEKKRLEEKAESKCLRLEEVDREFNKFSSEEAQTLEALDRFMEQYGFDGLPSPSIVPELFRLIRDLHEVVREKEVASKQQQLLENKIRTRKQEIEHVLKREVTAEGIYEIIRSAYTELKEKVEKKKLFSQKVEQLTPAIEEKNMLAITYRNELKELLEEAQVETEEAFYKTYDLYQEVLRHKERIKQIEQQLTVHRNDKELEKLTALELERAMERANTERIALNEQIRSLVQERASLQYKTEQLLSDAAHSEKRQLLEMKKAEFVSLAKKWSSFKGVSEAIKQMMQQLREEKLPEVLRRANQLFSRLTEVKYTALTLNEKGIFIAISSTDQRYPIVELSQATKEQAYISLRFALAESVLPIAPFPIIMDDPFVHFDERRLSRMIKVLGSLTEHQFIYFTCDRQMKRRWENATVINVSELGNKQEVIG